MSVKRLTTREVNPLLREQLRQIVADWLKRGLALRGTTAVQLAVDANVSRPTISEILNAKTDAEDATVLRLADALKIPPPEIRDARDLAGAAAEPSFAGSGTDLFEDLVRRPDEFTRRLNGMLDQVGTEAVLAFLEDAEKIVKEHHGPRFTAFFKALRDRVRGGRSSA